MSPARLCLAAAALLPLLTDAAPTRANECVQVIDGQVRRSTGPACIQTFPGGNVGSAGNLAIGDLPLAGVPGVDGSTDWDAFSRRAAEGALGQVMPSLGEMIAPKRTPAVPRTSAADLGCLALANRMNDPAEDVVALAEAMQRLCR